MQSNLSKEASDIGGISSEDHVNRNRLIAGLIILAVFIFLVISGSALFREWKSRQAQVGHREPLPSLGYCTPEQLTPCILSFSIDTNNRMVINILTDGSSANFHMKIRYGEQERLYECQKARSFAVRISCVGETMPAGEQLQFLMVSNQGNLPLAQGNFPIIGIALATPEPARTPTAIPFFDRPPK